ncbi:unnamed protein product [Oppiella nova]|uniref:F-box domain-containing protein n=1 Tax=Oppiella nova TaxID=334625 RepID=A0A7R9LXI7_9ACAR|nr:unnamed protein product [Oppiella nova]CAG2167962.1 unnamed protein product [Oppiella nova]
MGNCQKSRALSNRHLLISRYHSFCELNMSRKNKLRINDFNDDTLIIIFSMLTLKEKLCVLRVCKRWQRLVKVVLQKCVSIKMGEHSVKCHCHCYNYVNWDFPPHKSFSRDDCGYVIYPNPLLNYLMKLCPNLKCINLSHCYLDNNALKSTF